MICIVLSFILLSSVCNINARRNIQYLIFEGVGPDEGPGPNQTENIASLKRTFGEINPCANRMYAYGKQQMRILTRSIAFVRSELEIAFDLAEQTNIPLFIHIDPIYGWGADEENSTDNAPAIKYWKNETMREWIEFPSNETQLPNRIPRAWFNWGSWCSPSSAFPAIGAPNFLNFSSIQFNESISQPLGQWLEKLFNYGDEESMRENLAEAFHNGALIKAVYGALPFASEDPQPIGAIKAVQQWLNFNGTSSFWRKII